MNKKFIAILFVIIMCTLSGCSLIDNSGGNGSEFKITDDYLVGVFLSLDGDVTQDNYLAYPTDKFDGENAVSLYHAVREEQGHTYNELVSSKYLFDIFLGINNAGTNVSETDSYGKIEVKATFAYTYELLGSILVSNNVYKKNNKIEYYAERGTSFLLNNIGLSSFSTEQNLKASQTDADGTVKELKYDGKWTIDVKFVDYLISATIIEFDNNYNVIKTNMIDLTSDDFINYTTQPNCAYVFVEEEYEVKHSQEYYKYPIGTKYTERFFFDKSKLEQWHSLSRPAGNGFVESIGLKITFYLQ